MSKEQMVFSVCRHRPVSMTRTELNQEIEYAEPQLYLRMSHDEPRFSVLLSDFGDVSTVYTATLATLLELADTRFANVGTA
jgi:hypothetical protein